MRKTSNFLLNVSIGWVTLASVVIFLLFTALVLPKQAGQATPSMQAVGSPDLSFFYSPNELYGMAEAYGPEGRNEYIRARLTFDIIWPIVYALFLTTSISWIYSGSFDTGSLWQQANLIPLIGMLFDYLENLSTSVVMFRYPDTTPVIDFLAPIFTASKWIFVNGSFVILLIGIVKLVWDKIKYRSL